MRIVIDSDGGQNSTAQVISTPGQSSGALGSTVQVNAGAAPGAGGAGGGGSGGSVGGGASVSPPISLGGSINAGQAPAPKRQPASSRK
jgi:hypothetical protein